MNKLEFLERKIRTISDVVRTWPLNDGDNNDFNVAELKKLKTKLVKLTNKMIALKND